MSSRKENIYTKTSASKNIGGKFRQETPTGKYTPANLNSTFANMPSAGLKPKLDLASTFIHTPSVDYDLQSDIAYSNYLQALLFQKYTSNQMRKHTLSLNDQLSKYTDILSEKLETMHELEQSITEQKIQNEIQELTYHLEDKLERNVKELSPEVVFGFIKILQKLQYASNHLYLDKVKVLQNQDEYDRLQVILSKCGKVLSKIINASGDITKYQELNNCITRVKNYHGDICKIRNSVTTLQNDINKLALETVSDVLFENNNSIVKNIGDL